MTLNGIPEKITGDEDVGVVLEESVESSLDRDDPLELPGVLGHGLPVAIGIFDPRRQRCEGWAPDPQASRGA
jgi:hypothetical protein